MKGRDFTQTSSLEESSMTSNSCASKLRSSPRPRTGCDCAKDPAERNRRTHKRLAFLAHALRVDQLSGGGGSTVGRRRHPD